MIRLANKTDALSIVELVVEFLQQDNAYTQHTTNPDKEHIYSIVSKLLHIGYIWIYEAEDKIVGLLIAVKEPNIWYPDKVFLKEMIFYVKPEYRTSLASGKLFIAYMNEGARLLKEECVIGYTATSMQTTGSDYNLEKRGFAPKETLYIKEI